MFSQHLNRLKKQFFIFLVAWNDYNMEYSFSFRTIVSRILLCSFCHIL